jgi:hypothetical protein
MRWRALRRCSRFAVVTLIVAAVVSGRGASMTDVLGAADPEAFHRGFRAAMIVAGICAALGGMAGGIALNDTGSPLSRDDLRGLEQRRVSAFAGRP